MTQHGSKTPDPVSVSRNFERKDFAKDSVNDKTDNALDEMVSENPVSKSSLAPKKSLSPVVDRRSVIKNILPLAGESSTKLLRELSLGLSKLRGGK